MVIIPNKVTQNLQVFVDSLEACQVTRLFAVTSLVKNILSFVEMEAKRTAAVGGDKKLKLAQVKMSLLRNMRRRRRPNFNLAKATTTHSQKVTKEWL